MAGMLIIVTHALVQVHIIFILKITQEMIKPSGI